MNSGRVLDMLILQNLILNMACVSCLVWFLYLQISVHSQVLIFLVVCLFHSDTSIVPPLVYSLMGSSRELAIGPVAVVSMLLASLVQKIEDPVANPVAYRKLIFTVTFFAGIFQAAFGIFRYASYRKLVFLVTFFDGTFQYVFGLFS